jgi:cysteine desulfurase
VIFTSGATEANNAALHAAAFRDASKRHLVTSLVEHSAVLAYCDYLERVHGIEVTRLPVDFDGGLDPKKLHQAIRDDTALVSLMWANNETGVVWPVTDFAAICATRGVPFHTDAVQVVGKIPVHFGECGASFLSLSGHKFGAPKGIGALVIADPDSFVSFLHGGKQESGLRGGTENVAQIVALGAAAELVQSRGFDGWADVARLRESFERDVCRIVDGAEVNGARSTRLPNTSNIYFPGLDGDAVVTFLDQQGVCVSSGSACLESAITPSHVILAMTGSHDRASDSIHVSLGIETTEDDLLQVVRALQALTVQVH